MLIKRYRMREGKLPLLTIFTAGLFLGIIFMNFGKSILLKDTGLLDEYTLYELKYMTVDSTALFYYVLRQRLGELLVLAVLSTTYLGLIVCGGMTLWYGMCAGCLLATAVMRYGLKGILLVVVAVFPQFLLYVPAVAIMLLWCQGFYRYIYLEHGGGKDSIHSFLLSKRLLQLGGILLIALFGCILESFLNPYLLQGLLKIF